MWYGTSKNFLPADPGVLAQDRMSPSGIPRRGVVLQIRCSRHEVTLAAAEAAVQVTRLAVFVWSPPLMKPESVLEAGLQLGVTT